MAGTLLVIPGLGGSSLSKVGSLFPNTLSNVWYNPGYLGVYGPDDMDLAGDGVSPGPLASLPLAPLTSGPQLLPATRTYNGLLFGAINSNNWDKVLFVPYDWRLSVLVSGAAVASFVAKNAKTPPFYCLAYSLGGLVARVAYDLLRQQGGAGSWFRTVYVNTPHGGCHESVKALTNFPAKLFWTNAFLDVCGVAARRASRPFSSFSALDERCKQVIASWPSIYECMPNVQATYGQLDPSAAAYFAATVFAPFNSSVTQSRLDSALLTQKYLESLLTQPRPDEICSVGLGTLTAYQNADINKLNSDMGYDESLFGDGVVYRDRGQLPGTRTIYQGQTHADAIHDAESIFTILNATLNGISGDETIPVAPLPPARPIYAFVGPPVLNVPAKPLLQKRGDP
jgi:hypothetical protein